MLSCVHKLVLVSALLYAPVATANATCYNNLLPIKIWSMTELMYLWLPSVVEILHLTVGTGTFPAYGCYKYRVMVPETDYPQ